MDELGKLWKKWEIDHIKPVSHFKLVSLDDEETIKNIIECCSLENLRPLCSIKNKQESNHRTDEQIQFIKSEIKNKLNKK